MTSPPHEPDRTAYIGLVLALALELFLLQVEWVGADVPAGRLR